MSKIKTLYHRVILSFNKALVFSKKNSPAAAAERYELLFFFENSAIFFI